MRGGIPKSQVSRKREKGNRGELTPWERSAVFEAAQRTSDVNCKSSPPINKVKEVDISSTPTPALSLSTPILASPSPSLHVTSLSLPSLNVLLQQPRHTPSPTSSDSDPLFHDYCSWRSSVPPPHCFRRSLLLASPALLLCSCTWGMFFTPGDFRIFLSTLHFYSFFPIFFNPRLRSPLFPD